MSDGLVLAAPHNMDMMLSCDTVGAADSLVSLNTPQHASSEKKKDYEELSDFLLPLLVPEETQSRKRQRSESPAAWAASLDPFENMDFDQLFAEPDVELAQPMIHIKNESRPNVYDQKQQYNTYGYDLMPPKQEQNHHMNPLFHSGFKYQQQQEQKPMITFPTEPERRAPPQKKVKVESIKKGDKKEEALANKHQVYYRRAWSMEEDTMLIDYVKQKGAQQWSVIAAKIKTKNANQCSQRWNKALDPRIKKGHWTPQEDAKLLELVKSIGRKWKDISMHIEGRTGKQCRDRFTARLSKHIQE